MNLTVARGRPRTGTLEERNGRFYGRLRLADGTRSPRMAVPDGMTREQAARWLAGEQAKEDVDRMVYAAKLERERDEARQSGAAHELETVDAWHARYLAGHECGATHARLVAYQWGKWVSPVIGARPVRELTRDHVEDVRDALDAAIARGVMAPATARNVWSMVTSAMRAASASKDRSLRVHAAPLHFGVLPPTSGESRARPWLYPREWARLVACATVPLEWRRVYAVALYTGLRPMELRALEWRDVDLEARTLTVSRSWDDTARAPKAPKTAAGYRTFPLVPELVPLLAAMRGAPGELVAPELAAPGTRLRIAPQFRAHLLAAGVDRARLHEASPTEEPIDFRSLRDTFATWGALAGMAPNVLQRRLGHESSTTTDGYVKAAEDVTSEGVGAPFPDLSPLIQPTDGAPRGKKQRAARAEVGRSPIRKAPEVVVSRTSEARTPPTGGETVPTVPALGQGMDHADEVTRALAEALRGAAAAGRWDVVSQLAGELEARRKAGA